MATTYVCICHFNNATKSIRPNGGMSWKLEADFPFCYLISRRFEGNKRYYGSGYQTQNFVNLLRNCGSRTPQLILKYKIIEDFTVTK
jgi:hypothetical protein